jgi:hypothetical protein
VNFITTAYLKCGVALCLIKDRVNLNTFIPSSQGREDPKMDGWMDGVRRSMTNHGLTEENAIDRDMWRILVLDEGKITGQ